MLLSSLWRISGQSCILAAVCSTTNLPGINSTLEIFSLGSYLHYCMLFRLMFYFTKRGKTVIIVRTQQHILTFCIRSFCCIFILKEKIHNFQFQKILLWQIFSFPDLQKKRFLFILCIP